ncbi:hypothetical protein AUJ14_00310 [Candidatus Micrarchaeota archaeon CG1_02_55_22]|nr:MAG: hypothetical protein AUJ14_00310 [Candidatus Micrarchaeota archaeon CG1_02_55_22]
MTSLVRVTDLGVRYFHKQVVAGCSFELFAGEIFGLLGSNGSGKSSILRALCGLNHDYSGSIRFGNVEARYADLSRIVGFVPQDYSFYRDFTVEENIRFFAKLSGNVPRVHLLIEELGLKKYAHTRAGTLSGGFQRLLNISLALINSPKVVLLDEPTVGLDVGMREGIWALLERLREEGCAIVLTTHYLEEAEYLCDRIALVDAGTVHLSGTPKELINQYGGNTLVAMDLSADASGAVTAVKAIPAVLDVKCASNQLSFECRNGEVVDALSRLNQVLSAKKLKVIDVNVREPSLNQVFLNVIGHGL